MPTTVLTPTHIITLTGGGPTFGGGGIPNGIAWTGESNAAAPANAGVVDQNEDRDLDSFIDQYDPDLTDQNDFPFDYTGYTVDIGGSTYAIFEAGGTYVIPYHSGVEDLAAQIPFATRSTMTLADDGTAVNFCFLAGTLIDTPLGELAVEDLKIGDRLRTADGGTTRVLWIGRQRVARPANLLGDPLRAPVCIAAGALGNHSDLYVSADHGMVVYASSHKAKGDPEDGLVINASALVNGGTIRFVPASELPEQFTYYHIETEAHDVILANGAPSETFIDMAGRSAFDNYQEYLDLYGADRIIPEMKMPRIASARLVPQDVKNRLSRRLDSPRACA